jgi:uncharacterized protein YprB with RNaseH-like and TPR domain
VDERFRERLREIGGSRPRGRRYRNRRAGATLEDLGPAARTDGVLVVERSVADLISPKSLESLLSRYREINERVPDSDDIDDLLRGLIGNPDGALFVDTETTGLGANMVFMLGAMFFAQGDVRLRQVFARDYREEKALLDEWRGLLEGARLLVSFNGKAFDLPVLRDRLALHGAPVANEPPHLDLLHHSRRRWKDVLPDCRLQTLEWKICGRKRSGDIPGEEIPGVYHHYVRTGEASDIVTVFHHNALDLITLADLALALAKPR